MCLYSILGVLLIKASAALETCLMYKLTMKFVTDVSSFQTEMLLKTSVFLWNKHLLTTNGIFQNPNILLFCR